MYTLLVAYADRCKLLCRLHGAENIVNECIITRLIR